MPLDLTTCEVHCFRQTMAYLLTCNYNLDIEWAYDGKAPSRSPEPVYDGPMMSSLMQDVSAPETENPPLGSPITLQPLLMISSGSTCGKHLESSPTQVEAVRATRDEATNKQIQRELNS